MNLMKQQLMVIKTKLKILSSRQLAIRYEVTPGFMSEIERGVKAMPEWMYETFSYDSELTDAELEEFTEAYLSTKNKIEFDISECDLETKKEVWKLYQSI